MVERAPMMCTTETHLWIVLIQVLLHYKTSQQNSQKHLVQILQKDVHLNVFLCTRKSSKKALMFQHFDEYHSVSMYKCSKCCKTFDSKASFSLHLKDHEYGYMNISQVQRNYFFCHLHCCVNCSFRGLTSSTNIPRLF